MNKVTKSVGIALVAILLIAGATAVFAQNNESDTPTTNQPQESAPRIQRPNPGQLLDRELIEQAIAEALGISVEELQAARDEGTRLPELADELGVEMADVVDAIAEAVEESIAQAVVDGVITQEQADRILARIDLRHLSYNIFNLEDAAAVTADTLGISVEELQAALADGTTLLELADELGVEMVDVQTAVFNARVDAVQQALADELVTPQQANQILRLSWRSQRPFSNLRPGRLQQFASQP